MLRKLLLGGAAASLLVAATGAVAETGPDGAESPIYVPDPSALGLPPGAVPSEALPASVLADPVLPGLPDAADLPPVPVDVIEALILNTPGAATVLDNYVRTGAGDAAATGATAADRAVAVIYELRSYSEVVPPAQLLAAADTVMDVAGRLVCPAQIVCIEVRSDYQLPPGAVGYDFGGPGTPLVPGFERVSMNDPRIMGRDMHEVQRPGGHPLMHDGISGVQEMHLDVPPGEYRVIFVTDSNGTRNLERAPFGEVIYANGYDYNVPPSEPSLWPFIAWFGDRNTAISHTGGALQIRVDAPDGNLDIVMGFHANDDWQSYLTALVVEDVNAPTDLGATEEANTQLLPPEQCLFLDVLVADLLQGVTPAAGTPTDCDGPSPNNPDCLVR
ncbi:MAG: hypothetical protein R3F55_23675 [Alphaproteobacteria bacterium]